MKAARDRAALVLGVLWACLPGCRREATEEAAPVAASAAIAPPLETSWQKPRDTPLAVGDLAPDFVALAHTGHQVRLSTFLYRPTVVYFYPGDDADGASAEAESIRDAWLGLRDRIGMVLGVSLDDNVTHRAFATDRDLPFLLLSDVDGAVTRSFGVPVNGGRPSRMSFVIGTDRKVARVLEGVAPAAHGKRLVEALDELSK